MTKELSIKTSITKPGLTVLAVRNGWAFRFNLHNIYDGINIYRKRQGEGKFTYLATDTCSPYIDTDPMQIGTKYYACYIVGDKETGKRSNVVIIER